MVENDFIAVCTNCCATYLASTITYAVSTLEQQRAECLCLRQRSIRTQMVEEIHPGKILARQEVPLLKVHLFVYLAVHESMCRIRYALLLVVFYGARFARSCFCCMLWCSDHISSSKYYSMQDFKHLNVHKSTNLSDVHLNVSSFGAKFDKFQGLFNSCNLVPDVLIL